MASWDGDIGKELEIMVKEVTEEKLVDFERIMISMCAGIINTSPIGVQESEGEYQGNWQIDENLNDTVLKKKFQNGSAAGQKLLGVFRNAKTDKSMFIFNNLPYAAIIEYGGFPEPRVGTWNPKIKAYQKRSRGGYSLQAPSGHVRIEVRKANMKLGQL